jgi:serine beta-lactamase-like protein LACTB, mitochondrial
MRLLSSLLCLALCLPLWGQLSNSKEAALEQAAAAGISAARIPGLSVAVATSGGPIWTRAYGFSDLENHVLATPRTVFRLASISKTFTATAAMALVEKGLLDLDAEVQSYVPFPRKKWPVTTRQILAHQSGIRHYKGNEFNSTRHYSGVLESLLIFAPDPLEHQPGSKYLYSSYGFNLAGAVVERAAKTDYASFVRETILTPAAVESMRPDDVFAVIPYRARGYRARKDGTIENCDLADLSNKLPGGGWLATAEDLVLYARALMAERIVSRQSLDAMWTRSKLSSGETTGYGLGWNIAEVDGVKVVQHSGGQQGANTHLLLAPDKGIAIAVLANLESAGAPAIATQMLKSLLKEEAQ